MRIYTHPLSANAHKVILLLGFLRLTFDETIVDIPGGEQKGEAFGAVTPLRQIPVLDDNAVHLRDGQAILVYLGGRYGGGDWWPADPLAQAQIMQWLMFAGLEQQIGINLARLHFRLEVTCDLAAAQAQGRTSMALLDTHLADRRWLEHDRPTIADCACAPFAARCGEAGITPGDYPAVAAWLDRVRSLPGFIGMEGFA